MQRDEMSKAVRVLEGISFNLDLINKNLVSFLKRTDVRVQDSHIIQRDVPIPAPDLPVLPACAWCLGEIDHRGNERFYTCLHGTMCSACGPCDECDDGGG